MCSGKSATGKIKGTPNSMVCSPEELKMATRAIAIEDAKTGEITEAVYEHPFVVRLCHWVNAISLFVMVGSGFQIFRAFPSSEQRSRKKISSTGRRLLRLAGGWEARCNGTSPSCGSISRPASCTSVTRPSAETISKCSLDDGTCRECGQWYATTSSSVRSRL